MNKLIIVVIVTVLSASAAFAANPTPSKPKVKVIVKTECVANACTITYSDGTTKKVPKK